MPILLVVDVDKTCLPKGWVSAILPDSAVPTPYERSGAIWKPVSVPSFPEVGPRTRDEYPEVRPRCMVYDRGKIVQTELGKEIIAARIESLGSSIKTVPGPENLDRSHSTVWDYGPGQTYSTPQAAFDALLLQVGANPFTETHYIRGGAETYTQGPSGCVLKVDTVKPSSRFPLTIDAFTGHEVIFDGQAGNACLYGDGVDNVMVSSLEMSDAYAAVVPADPYAGGLKTENWLVEKCILNSDLGAMAIGALTVNTDLLKIRDCVMTDLNSHGVGGDAIFATDYSALVEVSGNLITATYKGLHQNADVKWILVNNTISSRVGLLKDGTGDLTIVAMLNNVFEGIIGGKASIEAPDIGPESVKIMRSDANVFAPVTEGMIAELDSIDYDLDEWRALFKTDAESIEADPQLDTDFTPLHDSPCLGRGVTWSIHGASGKRRAKSIDAGFEQVTRTRVPKAAARRKPEIGRRK